MQIISHRGHWSTDAEKNTASAFQRSFELGIGTETDFRDSLGCLVISHDAAKQDALPASDFFRLYCQSNITAPLALNVKADGLQRMFRELLDVFQIDNYFLFDMSIPDALQYIRQDFRIFTRQSELEKEPCFYEDAAGVWIDAFFRDWVDENTIFSHIKKGKEVCLVSPELHKRDHRHLWENVAKMGVKELDTVILCTDFPEEARRFFS